MSRRLVQVGVLWAAFGLHACAHTATPAPVKACVAELTADMTQVAIVALTYENYEAAITRRFAGLAACLVVAAVEAAVAEVRTMKLAGDPNELAAIARHGDAWLSARR